MLQIEDEATRNHHTYIRNDGGGLLEDESKSNPIYGKLTLKNKAVYVK